MTHTLVYVSCINKFDLLRLSRSLAIFSRFQVSLGLQMTCAVTHTDPKIITLREFSHALAEFAKPQGSLWNGIGFTTQLW